MSIWRSTLNLFLLFTLLLGLVYPLIVFGIGQLFFSYQANGSLIKSGNQVVGSELIGQPFSSRAYFWPRPSAVDYNPMPSGASNLSQTSIELQNEVLDRSEWLFPKFFIPVEYPVDLIYASGSGLDPHISLKAAMIQIPRILRARQLGSSEHADLERMVYESADGPQWGFLGPVTINVLKLNLELDRQYPRENS